LGLFALWIGILVCATLHVVAPWSFAFGFDSGFFAFMAAFIGIEAVLGRVLSLGGLRAGVRSSIFWVAFKFLVPLMTIWSGLKFGGDVLGVFCGLIAGLVTVAAVLWFSLRFYGER
jgi:hypothetical protein